VSRVLRDDLLLGRAELLPDQESWPPKPTIDGGVLRPRGTPRPVPKESTQELILQALMVLLPRRCGRQDEVVYEKLRERLVELQRERDPESMPSE